MPSHFDIITFKVTNSSLFLHFVSKLPKVQTGITPVLIAPQNTFLSEFILSQILKL